MKAPQEEDVENCLAVVWISSSKRSGSYGCDGNDFGTNGSDALDNEAIGSATAGGAGVSATATFESSNAGGATTDDSAAGGAGRGQQEARQLVQL